MSSPDYPASDSILRQEMVNSQLRARGIKDERLLSAMSGVPRHEFAPVEYRDQAYEDHPLPIGEGQTISQPYIVALMLEALEISPNDKVLEIGTGSGYLTALLAEMAAAVVSIERHPSLANSARALLSSMGYKNVVVFEGDGTRGYPDAAPYDVIIVSAASPEVPPALTDLLAEDGRMMIPVGSDDAQQLQLIRMEHGHLTVQYRELCRFVPLVPESQS